MLRFSVANWMSFRDPVSFSMIASKERQHGERLPQVRKYQMRVLPVTAIYGGNASGKTNFFKALNFARELVLRGTQPESLIPVEPFRLDHVGKETPTRFVFELLIDECIYEFSFAVTRKAVLEEKLVQISSSSEKALYSRQGNTIQFDPALDKEQFLHFAFQGTRDNQLYLTNAVSQKVDTFRPVYDWFKVTLVLIAPDSRFEPFEQFLEEGQPLFAVMNEMLPQLDSGIARLGHEVIPLDSLRLPDFLKKRLQEDVKEGMSVRMLTEPINERFVFTRTNGELVAKKLVTYHAKADGTEARFEMHQESDGSQRLVDLLPAFLELAASGGRKVFVIDELDRSLHALLTRKMIETYLATCSADSRSQLLLTTHDVLLMDQEILRRDEMWVAERDATGASTLVSFSDYKDVRYDKDIRKSYLQGRLGGVPRILLNAGMSRADTSTKPKVKVV